MLIQSTLIDIIINTSVPSALEGTEAIKRGAETSDYHLSIYLLKCQVQ